MTGRLEHLRSSRFGLVLFYSYLIAILLFAVIAARGYDKLAQTTDRLDMQAELSCAAIESAAAYWRNERELAFAALADPQTMPGARERQGRRIAALNRLLSAGALLDCDGKR